jgi:glutaredoxin
MDTKIDTYIIIALIVVTVLYYIYINRNKSEKFRSNESRNVESVDLVLRNGKTYLTGNPKKGVLLAITADWCGYCTKLKNAVKESGISSYYFDATDNNNSEIKNKLSELNVNSFPTVFKIDNGGELISYDGSRDPQELRKNFL